MSLKTKTPNHARACQEHEDSQEVTPKVEVQDQKGDNKLRSKRRTPAQTGGRRQEAGGRRQEAGGKRQEAGGKQRQGPAALDEAGAAGLVDVVTHHA